MAKKQIERVFFRLEWWQFLRWKSPNIIAEVMTRFMNHCSGISTETIDMTKQPTEAEQYLYPMIMQFEKDKTAYDDKCNQLRINGSKSHDTDTNATKCYQMLPIATNEEDLVTKERKGKEKKGNINNIFFSREETSPEKEKKETLFNLSLYFLEKAVLKPYSVAEKAWNYNEAQGWKSVNANGSIKDYSRNKLAFLKGWKCEESCYSLQDAAIFKELYLRLQLDMPEVIDNFHGIKYNGGICFMFDKKAVADRFTTMLRNDKALLDIAAAFVREQFPEVEGFKGVMYSKD